MNTRSFYPGGLKALPVWVLWKKELNKYGKLTKVPYSAHYNGRASTKSPESWSNYDLALERLKWRPGEYDGLGVVISKKYRMIFIDIDHCIENGVMDERATDILGVCPNQFVEVSQSGTGIHILALGEIRKNSKNSALNVEIYNDERFCALTGNALIASEMHEDPTAIKYIYDKYKTPERSWEAHTRPRMVCSKSDEWILDKAMRRGGQFPLLYVGEWQFAGYPSQSEADLALCTDLAFWTDRDESAIERIFRSSGLYREKFEREDYRRKTISRAISQVSESYSEWRARKAREEEGRGERGVLDEWRK